VTAGLLAMVAAQHGRARALGWMGWQIPIIADDAHGKARIEDIPPEKLVAAMDRGEIAVIAGFQGVTRDGRIATLGRGGSDTSAVAIAAGSRRSAATSTPTSTASTPPTRASRAKARRWTRSPTRRCWRWPRSAPRCCRPARSSWPWPSACRPARALESFVEPGEAPNQGTIVCDEEEIMEKRIVSGVAYSRDEAKITLFGLPDHPASRAAIFGRLADANVNVDMIVQSRPATEATPTWSSPSASATPLARSRSSTPPRPRSVSRTWPGQRGRRQGLGDRRRHAQPRRRRQVDVQGLADKGVNIQVISTSEIKISVLIDAPTPSWPCAPCTPPTGSISSSCFWRWMAA
jgi:aspartate kinase